NLYELAVVLLTVPLKLDGIGQTVVAAAALAIVAAVLVGIVLFWLLPRAWWWTWWLFGPLLTGGIWASLFFLLKDTSDSYYRLLAVEWCVVMSGLLYRLLKPYCITRDQSGGWKFATGVFAIVLGVATVAWFLIHVFSTFPQDPPRAVYTAGLRTFEALFFLVTVAWILLFALVLLQSL